jgi:HPt (histidine-containing phosphotransfer) domain-containing protein
MLESLGQGFMLIDPQGLCLPIYSSACERLFLKSPAGQNIWDILQLNEKQLSNMQSWLRTIFTEALNFQSLLPLALKQVELGGRTIGLEYHEMRGADDRIEMLMIVATDNTLLIKAEKKAADQKAEAQAILTLVSDPKRYFESITLTENAITLLQQVNFDKVTVKRALHNLKGIAGFGHLLALQSLAHEIEDKIDLPDFSAKVAIEQLLTILNVYREKYSALLPETAEDANAVKVSSSTARAFAQILAHLDIPVQVRREFVDKFILIPAAKMIQRLNGVLRDTATMLGKEAHNIEITGGGFASRP